MQKKYVSQSVSQSELRQQPEFRRDPEQAAAKRAEIIDQLGEPTNETEKLFVLWLATFFPDKQITGFLAAQKEQNGTFATGLNLLVDSKYSTASYGYASRTTEMIGKAEAIALLKGHLRTHHHRIFDGTILQDIYYGSIGEMKLPHKHLCELAIITEKDKAALKLSIERKAAESYPRLMEEIKELEDQIKRMVEGWDLTRILTATAAELEGLAKIKKEIEAKSSKLEETKNKIVKDLSYYYSVELNPATPT